MLTTIVISFVLWVGIVRMVLAPRKRDDRSEIVTGRSFSVIWSD